MRHNQSFLRTLQTCAAFACLALPLHAQTVDDGLMMAKRELLTGNVYTHDTWDEYWEGTLKRRNGNIGEITTRTNAWVANYGLTDRFNVMGAVPYMWTRASQGVLHGDRGLQDLTLAAKYKFLEQSSPTLGTLRAFAVASAGIPMTRYNNELLPLSLGTRSTQVAWRGTLNYQASDNWFVTGTTAYAWRSQTQLSRPYFYTDDAFTMTDTVDMPNAMDFGISGGMMTRRLMAAVFLSRQRTLGGGDIRRQDMPFVSNRMNASKAGVMAMLPIPWHPSLQFQFALAQTFEGRNVGDSTSITTGILYRFNRRVTR